jgi:hypothetical protein
MSVRALTWAFGVRGVSDGTKLLLLVLADYADENGVCWPSRRALCDHLGKSADTVDRRVAELVECGLLDVESRSRPSQNGKIVPLSNVYRLDVEGPNRGRISAGSRTPEGSRKNAATDDEAAVDPPPDDPGRISAGGRNPAGSRTFAATLAAPDAATLAADLRAHNDEPPIRTTIRLAAADGAPALAEAPNVAPIPDEAGLIATWFAELVAAAGPGLSDPAKEGALHATAGELAAWARAGVDLEADAVPVIRAKTAKPRAQPIRTWGLFRADVLAAAARRQQQLVLPTLEPTETAHGQRTHASSRSRADDARRAGMLWALQDADARKPWPDEGGAPDADAGAPRRLGGPRAGVG